MLLDSTSLLSSSPAPSVTVLSAQSSLSHDNSFGEFVSTGSSTISAPIQSDSSSVMTNLFTSSQPIKEVEISQPSTLFVMKETEKPAPTALASVHSPSTQITLDTQSLTTTPTVVSSVQAPVTAVVPITQTISLQTTIPITVNATTSSESEFGDFVNQSSTLSDFVVEAKPLSGNLGNVF